MAEGARYPAKAYCEAARARVCSALEQGAWRSAGFRAAARLWEWTADPVRPLVLPTEARVVGIGGATLGGSGKTPLALALARDLAGGGSRIDVVVVASAYRATLRTARQVRPDDQPSEVGDEALMLCRRLACSGVCVVSGPRQGAVLLAARLARGADHRDGQRKPISVPLVLVDGLLQARPDRLARSLLVLDASAPWGAGACPPAGDLRATRARLLAAADALAVIDPGVTSKNSILPVELPSFAVGSRLELRNHEGAVLPLATLRARSFGLALAIARPQRVLRRLAQHAITPVRQWILPDHSPFRLPPPAGAGVELWLTTAKCSTKLPVQIGGAPVWVLETRLDIPPALRAWVLSP